MATTTNFGWETPDDTDLVKDGALAMRTLGNAIDTSLVDLKGGTTGQNLRKNSNTDMDFVWAGDATNTVVDAEGDLLVGDSADTLQRLAIGTTGQVLTVDTTVDGKIKWASAAATSGPAFRAFRNTSQQAFNQATWTKVQLNGEDFDTDNCFDNTTNYRFTPNKAGYYSFQGIVFISKTGQSQTQASIYKNGTQANHFYNLVNTSTFILTGGSALLYMNGTTDYVELYVYDNDPSGRNIVNGSSEGTVFSGVWIRS